VEGSKYGEGRDIEREGLCSRLVCACVVPTGNWLFNRKKEKKIKGVISTLVLMFSSCRPHSLSIKL
jgi:hypothetical protein